MLNIGKLWGLKVLLKGKKERKYFTSFCRVVLEDFYKWGILFMRVTISFRNIQHTQVLDQKIKEKSEKLGKFLEGKTLMKWACNFEDGHYYAEVSIIGPHFEYHAHGGSENLYKTLDVVSHKIHKQIQKRKEKWKNKIHRNPKEVVILDPEQAWGSYGENKLKDVS